jgi:GNAT superfamily N-acetyltransferase
MTTTDLIIRDARADERDAIRDLTLAAYQQYEKVMPAPVWASYRRNIVATLEGPDAGEQIVAEWDGRLAGSISFYPQPTDAYSRDEPPMPWPMVRLLAVSPAERDHGIGAALVAECEHRARQAGATALGLHTADMMQAATHLYQRLGFVRAPAHDFHPTPEIVIKAYYHTFD